MNKKLLLKFLLNFFLFIFLVFVFSNCIPSIGSEINSLDETVKHFVDEIYGAGKFSTQTPQGRQTPHTSKIINNATIKLLFIRRNWNNLSDKTKIAISSYVKANKIAGTNLYSFSYKDCKSKVGENNLTTYIKPNGHFSISYTTSLASPHKVSSTDVSPADGTPDFINKIADIAEEVWDYEINKLKFPPPPLLKEYYEIFVCDIFGDNTGTPGKYLGLANTYTETSDLSLSSYIDLDNSYPMLSINPNISMENLIRVVFAHEFFHAIQFGINWKYPSYWLLEATAVWIEDVVYPDINDYIHQYMGDWFKNTDVPLDYFSFTDLPLHGYGNAIFFKFISEVLLNNSAIRDIWLLEKNDRNQSCGGIYDTYDSNYNCKEVPMIANYLKEKIPDKNFSEIFHEFAIENLLRENYFDKNLYKSKSLSFYGQKMKYPIELTDVDKNTNDLQQYYTSKEINAFKHLSTRYFVLYPEEDGIPKELLVYCRANKTIDWKISAAGEISDNNYELIGIPQLVSENFEAQITINNFGTKYKKIYLIVSNATINSAYDNSQTSNFYFYSELPQIQLSQMPTPPFPQGWNLISIPLYSYSKPNDAFNESNLNNKVLGLQNGSYIYSFNQNFKGFDYPGRAFWIEMDTPKSFIIRGNENKDNPFIIPLTHGWNLFGNPFLTEVSWSDSNVRFTKDKKTYVSLSEAENIGLIKSTLYSYNPQSLGYEKLYLNSGNLKIWKGYWIFSLSAEDIFMEIKK